MPTRPLGRERSRRNGDAPRSAFRQVDQDIPRRDAGRARDCRRRRVWVAVAPAPPRPPAAGGVAHLTSSSTSSRSIPHSPSSPGSATRLARTLSRTRTSRHPKDRASSPRSPKAMPTPDDGGRTYTFTIRPGFRFSPPSNEPVTAATFKATIERVANPRLKSPFASQFSGVVGYHAYVSGKARGLAGIVAHGRTLTIKLSRPDGGFLTNLASRRGVRGAPRHAGRPRRTRRRPVCGAVLHRLVHTSPAAHPQAEPELPRRAPAPSGPDRVAIGVDTSHALAEIEAGTADYALDGLPRAAGPRLAVEVRPRQQGREGRAPAVLRQPRATETRWLHMNTSRPLFARVDCGARSTTRSTGRLSSPRDERFAEVESVQRRRADRRLPARFGRRRRRLSGLSDRTGPDLRPGEAPRRARPRDRDHVHAQPAALAAGGAGRPARPRAARDRRRGEGVPDRRVLRAHRASRRAVRPRRVRVLALQPLIRQRVSTSSTAATSVGSATPTSRTSTIPPSTGSSQAAAKLSGPQALPRLRPARAGARARLRPGRPVRDRREPRLLLRTDRMSDLPARLRHRPGRAVPATRTT